jgi:hypothetical protein
MTVASLNAGLLARKGDARPSVISHQEPWPSRAAPAAQAASPQAPAGRSADAAGCAPEGCAGGLAAGPDAPRAQRDRRGRVRLSVRLDAERHRRLRLAALLTETTIQELLTAALDARLDALGLDCPCVRAAGRTAGDGEGIA